MKNTYAGESLAKKVARVRTYLRAKEMLTAAGKTDNISAVVLAGPEGAELGCLAHIMKPSIVYVIDKDPKCVGHFFDKAENYEALDGITFVGYEGELKNFRPNGVVDFANFDLMGNLNGHQDEDTEAALRQIDLWSVVAVTYLRGRETGEVRTAMSLIHDIRSEAARKSRRRWGPDIKRAAGILGYLHVAWHAGIFDEVRDGCRKAGYLNRLTSEQQQEVDEILSSRASRRIAFGKQAYVMKQQKGVHFTPIAGHCYQADVSPMGVLIAQLISEKDETKNWVRHLDGKTSRLKMATAREKRLISSTIKKDPMVELLQEADYLFQEGFSKQSIAEIFDVSVGTMAAWKAHRTMGTYAA
jgi:hypothetical protein